MKNVVFDLGAVLIEWDPALAFADIFTHREAAEDWLADIDFPGWNRHQDAGRSFAAYGGIYIAASLLWLWLVEGTRPGLYDLTGGALTLLGAAVILWGARG